MTSLNDILWGEQLGNSDDGKPGDGTDPGIVPQFMQINCLEMCCSLGTRCNTHPIPCASGYLGCK